MKPIGLLGTSLRDLKAFPEAARREAGHQLYRVQLGLEPNDWKPLASVGPGVQEIRLADAAGIFRVIYTASRAEAVYVLHTFQKKTPRTTKRDLELAKARLRELMQRTR